MGIPLGTSACSCICTVRCVLEVCLERDTLERCSHMLLLASNRASSPSAMTFRADHREEHGDSRSQVKPLCKHNYESECERRYERDHGIMNGTWAEGEKLRRQNGSLGTAVARYLGEEHFRKLGAASSAPLHSHRSSSLSL